MRKVCLFTFWILLFTSCHAQTWSPVGSGTTFGQIESMCVYNGELYVGGYFNSMGGIPVNSLARWNGITWDSVPGMYAFPGIDIADMVVWQNQLVIVGNHVHTWNGTTWSTLGGWINGSQVGAEVFNNELYITGNFSNAGGTPTRGIAKWNGTQWDSLNGPGLDYAPGFAGHDLLYYNGSLILGGEFTTVNGLYARGIASWDGISFDTIGNSSTIGAVLRLATYNNDLYASGIIPFGNYQHTIARWNGQQWDSVGFGLNRTPYTMSVYNNELYAMGEFDTAGLQPILGIARWNDTVWNSVGSGLDLMNINIDTIVFGLDTLFLRQEVILSSCVYNNELYVGGYFSMIGGIAANSIAKWHDFGANVEAYSSLDHVTISPNPAHDIATFQFTTSTERTVIVTDQAGREIWRRETTDETVEFPAGEFAAGMYFYLVSDEGGLTAQGKFLIQH